MMIGYDRPLKPEWIYKSLRMVQPGKRPEEFYDAYNDIAVELTGKDGRRKTRTVLFRTFIYRFQDTKTVIENNFLIELSKQKNLEYMKPIYLSMFIIDYDILTYFTQIYYKIFDASQQVSSTALTKKMTEAYGDAEIIKRSTRSFLKTLTDFNIIKPRTSTIYDQSTKKTISEEQVADILYLYSIVKGTKQIDLLNLDKSIFAFYDTPNLSVVANKFHIDKWEYINGLNRELIIL